jgi:hypothetical protein
MLTPPEKQILGSDVETPPEKQILGSDVETEGWRSAGRRCERSTLTRA